MTESMTYTTQNTSLLSCCIHYLLFFNKITPKCTGLKQQPFTYIWFFGCAYWTELTSVVFFWSILLSEWQLLLPLWILPSAPESPLTHQGNQNLGTGGRYQTRFCCFSIFFHLQTPISNLFKWQPNRAVGFLLNQNKEEKKKNLMSNLLKLISAPPQTFWNYTFKLI